MEKSGGMLELGLGPMTCAMAGSHAPFPPPDPSCGYGGGLHSLDVERVGVQIDEIDELGSHYGPQIRCLSPVSCVNPPRPNAKPLPNQTAGKCLHLFWSEGKSHWSLRPPSMTPKLLEFFPLLSPPLLAEFWLAIGKRYMITASYDQPQRGVTEPGIMPLVEPMDNCPVDNDSYIPQHIDQPAHCAKFSPDLIFSVPRSPE